MIVSYLLHEGIYETVQPALQFYGEARTFDMKVLHLSFYSFSHRYIILNLTKILTPLVLLMQKYFTSRVD